MADNDHRAHVGWLIWCVSEGYVKAEDRAVIRNWLLYDDRDLNPHDVDLKADLLAMADEVLADG